MRDPIQVEETQKGFQEEVTSQLKPEGGVGFGWMERGGRLRERHMQRCRGIKRTTFWEEQKGQGIVGLQGIGRRGGLQCRPHPHLLFQLPLIP